MSDINKTYRKEIIKLSHAYIKKENEKKAPFIKNIIKIITPYFYESKLIKSSSLSPKKKFLKIAELKQPIFIPEVLTKQNTLLDHSSSLDHCFYTNYISDEGLVIEFGTIDFYDLDISVLKLILFQLEKVILK